MKPRDYCCCAIPVIYAGIYTTLVEQFTLGIVAGTLSVATPSIVGAATPSFAKWIFAIICYVGAALQLLGLHAVWSERPITFRRYTTLHLLITIAAFSVAAVWIALSAARHSHAEATCEATFFPENSSITSSEGQTLCNVFSWVDVGLMGGLWVLLAIVQVRSLRDYVHPLDWELREQSVVVPLRSPLLICIWQRARSRKIRFFVRLDTFYQR
ncbi:hypothetical protein AcW1_000756 [Taiwanofungus camphoratus]|nr:hypothetical protein AcW1_000756 [Antrodia cinnamomea]